MAYIEFYPLTLMVHEKFDDHELLNEITWFWSGEKIPLKRARRRFEARWATSVLLIPGVARDQPRKG